MYKMYGYMPATSMGLLCDVQGLTLLSPWRELPLTYGCEALSFHEPSWHVPFLGDYTQV